MAKKKTQQQLQQYRESLKYNLWVKHFLDIRNTATFGNATQSAIVAYKLDPVKQYSSAGTMGKENYKKLQNMNSTLMDQLGYSFGELMKIGMKKMLDGSYDDWEKFMKRLGYFDKEGDQPPGNYTQVNVNLGDAISQARKERGLPIIKGKTK